MRPIEASFIGVGLLALVAMRRPKHLVWLRHGLSALAALLAILQAALEGYRWQMIPAYAGILILLLISFAPMKWATKVLRLATGMTVFFLAAGLCAGTVYPVFRLPEPTGPFRIGTVTYHFVDDRRPEIFSRTPGSKREIMVQAWYPAEPGLYATTAPYRERAATSFQSEYLTLVQSHAYLEAPVEKAKDRYPLVIFTPSWHGVRNQNLFQVEELVSHGFVVLGVDHPYGSAVTVFPDGRVIQALPDKFLDTTSEQSLKESFQIAEQQLNVRAADLSFLLDTLESADQTGGLGILDGKLDLDRVAILGYSFGGAVAAQACWKDPRFKGAINMDGDLFGESATHGIEQPYLAMSDSFSEPGAKDLNSPNLPWRRWEQVIDQQAKLTQQTMEEHGGYTLEIPSVAHGNFSDSALFSPVRRLTGSGSMDPRAAMNIVNEYTVAFFSQVLNHSPQRLLEASFQPYREAQLRVYVHPGNARAVPQVAHQNVASCCNLGQVPAH
jgi:predicted dienelactone hydrolase